MNPPNSNQHKGSLQQPERLYRQNAQNAQHRKQSLNQYRQQNNQGVQHQQHAQRPPPQQNSPVAQGVQTTMSVPQRQYQQQSPQTAQQVVRQQSVVQAPQQDQQGGTVPQRQYQQQSPQNAQQVERQQSVQIPQQDQQGGTVPQRQYQQQSPQTAQQVVRQQSVVQAPQQDQQGGMVPQRQYQQQSPQNAQQVERQQSVVQIPQQDQQGGTVPQRQYQQQSPQTAQQVVRQQSVVQAPQQDQQGGTVPQRQYQQQSPQNAQQVERQQSVVQIPQQDQQGGTVPQRQYQQQSPQTAQQVVRQQSVVQAPQQDQQGGTVPQKMSGQHSPPRQVTIQQNQPQSSSSPSPPVRPQQAPQQKAPPQPMPQFPPLALRRPSQMKMSRLTPEESRRVSMLDGLSTPRSQSPSGRFIGSSKGMQVETLSYEGYARHHFDFDIAEKRLTKDKIDDRLRFTLKEIKRPLLKSVSGVKTTWMAITVFAHIMAYMAVIPGLSARLRHMYQVLSVGISRPDLRDEIYCQLCKQTCYNAIEEKEKKGWDLLLLCCSSFPPSEDLLPYLEGHFREVVAGEANGFKGDDQAQRCLQRLQRVAISGPRYFLPSSDEIVAIQSEMQIPVNIYLPVGAYKVLSVHTMATTAEVAKEMTEEIGLPDPFQYGIFQSGSDGVEKLCAQQGYIIDIQNGWSETLKLQALEDWRLKEKIKYFFASRAPINEVDDANDISSIPTSVGNKKGRFVLKRKLFLDTPASNSQTSREKIIEFGYSQAVHEVMTGAYLLKWRDTLMLGSLQLRADLEDTQRVTEDILRSIDMHRYEPKTFVTGNRDEWRAELVKTMQNLPVEADRLLRKSDYTDYLKSKCPLYQSTWFFVKQTADSKLLDEMFVAINATGVCFAHPKTKEPVLQIPYTEICSWGHSVAVASIVTGNMTYNHEHRLITRQGAEIGATIELYISQMQM